MDDAKWYVVHTYSGFEKHVKTLLENKVQTQGLEEEIGEVLIPTEDVVELKNGKRKVSKKKTFPGYILVNMEMNKKYGFRDANKWLEADWTRALYLHDADTASFIPYCYSYDLTRLAEEGLFFLDNFNHQPPKHLGTFIDFVKEFVSYVTNRTSGGHKRPLYFFSTSSVGSLILMANGEG